MNKIAFLLLFLLLTSTGCSTIVSDSSYSIPINSDPAGADVEIIRDNGATVFTGKTPATAFLKAGDSYFDKHNYIIKMTKAGYDPVQMHLQSSIEGWYWGNILFGGIIGLFIVDPITGAMFEFDQEFIQASLAKSQTGAILLSENTDSIEGTPTNAAEKLKTLKKLMDQGVITKEDYNRKKKEVLDLI